MLVYQIDENGIYVKDVMIDSLDGIPSDCVAIKPPTETQGFWRLKWTGAEWVEDADASYLLGVAKDKKIQEFATLKDTELLAWFTTDAVAAMPNIQMGYSPVDQSNIRGLANMLSLDPTLDNIQFLTGNYGMVTFSRSEFIQVIKDAFAHDSTLQYKYLALREQVNAATSQAELDAIMW